MRWFNSKSIQLCLYMVLIFISWLLMHYPVKKSTRVTLARLYYELCLVPGIEPRVLCS